MKIVLAFEHVRRLVGAHSHLITALGERLVERGHDVTIVCDSVVDPDLFPGLRFVNRRPFQPGDSHRLLVLHHWARRTMRRLDYDVSLSFFPPIPADAVVPSFGWLQTRLAREDRYLRQPVWGRIKRLHPTALQRRLVESALRTGSEVRAFVALSQDMAEALLEVDSSIQSRLRVVAGASPIEPPADATALERMRREAREDLGLGDDEVVFFWGSKQAMLHGAGLLIRAFGEAVRAGNLTRARLVLAGEWPYRLHARTVDRDCDGQVRVLGRTAEVDRLLAACDVVVNPAVHSTLGRSVWEALAFGKPVIASSATGGVDRMRDANQRLAGIVVPACDAAALRDAIVAMADASRLGAATRSARSIAPSMRFDDFVGRVEGLLEELVQSKRNAN